MLHHASAHTDALQIHRKVSAYNYFVVLFAALGSVIYGYDSSVIATTLGQPTFYEYFNLVNDPTAPGYNYTTQITGACNALAQVGGLFGCFINAWSADRFGRRASFQIASVLCFIGSAVQCSATTIAVLLVFRFINGLGVGMLLTVTPLYQSELSPPYARGVLVGSHGAFLAIGYNIASWVGLGCFFAKNGEFAWRFPLALQVLFPMILFAGSFWLPPSPRWLVAKERVEEARSVLLRLHQAKEDPDNVFANAECDQIVSQIALEKRKHHEMGDAERNGFFYLFSRPSYRKRALIGFTIMFGAQCTGVLVINNYQIILFPSLGISPAMSLGLYSIYLAIALVGNSTCGFIVDRVGRRPCLLVGLVGCLFALTGETILASFAAHTSNHIVLGFAVAFIFLYIPFFATLIDPNMYIYVSEIFPAEVRSQGVAFSVAGQWLATICFLQSAPTAFANIGYKFYIVFIVCTVALWFIVYFYFPETKGLSLEEMAKVFGDDVVSEFSEEYHEHQRRFSKTEEKGANDDGKEIRSQTVELVD